MNKKSNQIVHGIRCHAIRVLGLSKGMSFDKYTPKLGWEKLEMNRVPKPTANRTSMTIEGLAAYWKIQDLSSKEREHRSLEPPKDFGEHQKDQHKRWRAEWKEGSGGWDEGGREVEGAHGMGGKAHDAQIKPPLVPISLPWGRGWVARPIERKEEVSEKGCCWRWLGKKKERWGTAAREKGKEGGGG